MRALIHYEEISGIIFISTSHLKYSDTMKSNKLTASQAPKNSNSVNESMINEASAYFKNELELLFKTAEVKLRTSELEN